MSETKHTPGPWRVDERLTAVFAGHQRICDIRGWGFLTGRGDGARGLPHPEAVAIQDANARLIAAAPDLLEALENIVYHWGSGADDLELALRHHIDEARRLITAARGETQ